MPSASCTARVGTEPARSAETRVAASSGARLLGLYEPVPAELEVLATTSEGEIMALKHREHPTYGVQFHPESILTEHGKKLLKNFLDLKPAPIAGGELAMLKPFIAKAINRTDLTTEEAEEAMNVIMTGQATPAQIAALELPVSQLQQQAVDKANALSKGD